MKLGAALTLIGLGVSAGAFAIVQGCSSDSTDSGTTGAGKLPPAEEGSPTTSTDERTFAVDSISLGETDRSGVKSQNAWKKYGFNLDGQITNVVDQKSPDLAKVCKRTASAKATVHQDGDEGIDNAFGKEILSLLDSFTAAPSKDLSDSLKRGDFTLMFKVVGLTDDPTQTNTGLSGTLLVGGKFEGTPTFSPSDDWPYMADPQVPITGAYVNKGVFVNGKSGATVKLNLSIQGQALDLSIHKAIISFKHDPATKSLSNGTIAGVLDTKAFVTSLGAIAGRFSTELCEGATLENIKTSISQASDMLADGTQDPAKECNGMSIAIGFSAKQVGKPTKIAPPEAPPPDPCDPSSQTDAGAGDGG